MGEMNKDWNPNQKFLAQLSHSFLQSSNFKSEIHLKVEQYTSSIS